jgi:predicted nucleic acid-binding protein
MVFADTSVWIPFFNRPASRDKGVLDLLINADEVALVGVVLAEVLQGCRSQEERDDLTETLIALPGSDPGYLDQGRQPIIHASSERHYLALSDLVIAARR